MLIFLESWQQLYQLRDDVVTACNPLRVGFASDQSVSNLPHSDIHISDCEMLLSCPNEITQLIRFHNMLLAVV